MAAFEKIPNKASAKRNLMIIHSHVHSFFSHNNIVFLAQVEHFYFSADSKLKILL